MVGAFSAMERLAVVVVSRSWFGRVFLGFWILVAGVGGAVGTAYELHGPLRTTALVACGAVAGLGLAAIVWGRRADAIDSARRKLVTFTRWFGPGWRRRRERALDGAVRVAVHAKVGRTSKGRSYVYYPVRLETAGAPIDLDVLFEPHEARRVGIGAAAALGLPLVQLRAGADAVTPAGEAGHLDAPDARPVPLPLELHAVREGDAFRCTLPPPGLRASHKRALVILGFLALCLSSPAIIGFLQWMSRPEAWRKYLELLIPSSPFLVAGVVPLAMVLCHAVVWRDRVEASPRGLTVRRRLPFPGRTRFLARAELREVELERRATESVAGFHVIESPRLLAYGDAEVVGFGGGRTEGELEALRQEILHALGPEPPPDPAARRPVTGAPADFPTPGLRARVVTPALVLAGVLAAWGAAREPWVSDVIAAYRDRAEPALARLAAVRPLIEALPPLAQDGFDTDTSVIDLRRWYWTGNGAPLHLEDLQAIGTSVTVQPRIGVVADFLHESAARLKTGLDADGREPRYPRGVEGTFEHLLRLRWLLVIRARPEAPEAERDSGRWQGEAILVDLEGPRVLGGVRFGAEGATSAIDAWVRAEFELAEKLRVHAPGMGWK